MGLTPKQYYSMTPAEFILMSRGYRQADERKWQKVRFLGYQTYLSRPIKGRHQRITSWHPLPSDKHDKPDIDYETIKRLMKPIDDSKTAS